MTGFRRKHAKMFDPVKHVLQFNKKSTMLYGIFFTWEMKRTELLQAGRSPATSFLTGGEAPMWLRLIGKHSTDPWSSLNTTSCCCRCRKAAARGRAGRRDCGKGQPCSTNAEGQMIGPVGAKTKCQHLACRGLWWFISLQAIQTVPKHHC